MYVQWDSDSQLDYDTLNVSLATIELLVYTKVLLKLMPRDEMIWEAYKTLEAAANLADDFMVK